MRYLRPNLLLPFLLTALTFLGCSTDDGSETTEPQGPRVVEIEPTTKFREQVADYGTDVLAAVIDSLIFAPRPVLLPTPDQTLIDLLETEAGDRQLLSAQISESALARRPFVLTNDDLSFFVIDDGEEPAGFGPLEPPRAGSENLSGAQESSTTSLARGVSSGDADLKAAIGEFIETIKGTGLDTGQFDNAWNSTRFHSASEFPGGLPEGTSDGAAFLWGDAVFWNAAWHNGGILYWSDGFNHIVLADRHVEALKAREFVGADFQLGAGTATVLHELGHVIMSRTRCARDDDADAMAATLERVVTNRVEMELARTAQGAPRAPDINSYSDKVSDLVVLGGINCLRDLGWGLPAETISVTAPRTVQAGQSFDAEIFVKRIGGDPAGNEFVWTWVDSDIEVIGLNGSGIGTRTIVAPNEPGEIRIRVKALGKETTVTVQVVSGPVGACCIKGECSLLTELACDGIDEGDWEGAGVSCSPNPCLEPLEGACCSLGECFLTVDSLACVVDFNGDWAGEGVVCSQRECPIPDGACCATGGSCTFTAEQDCPDTFLGVGTVCDPNPCPQPGACCIGTNCVLRTESACDGKFQGPGTVCDPDPCFVPGACCLSNGDCQLVLESECSGNFLGEKAPCDPNPCPQRGACCNEAGECTLTLQSLCDAVFQGEGTVCDPNPCPEPPEGACCFGNSNELCTVRSAARCSRELGGTYLGDGTTCFSEPCTDPLAGACCLSSTGRCEFLREAACVGEFKGIGQACSPGLCDPVDGACCVALGACVIQSQENCIQADGQYQGNGTSCDPNPCDQKSTGACCIGEGTCTIQTESACNTNAGDYRGGGVACSPNPCSQPDVGACCFEQGSCQLISAAACADSPGSYSGDGTVCNPNSCPQPGACCFPSGTCQILDEQPCTSQSGRYLGESTSCDPNPCATGACCIVGACTVTQDALCDGEYQGDDTDCDPNVCPQPATGACCAEDTCAVVTQSDCGGTYQGDDTPCDPNPCTGSDLGACCFNSGSCLLGSQEDCLIKDGVYVGDGTTCDPNPCLPRGACCQLGECFTSEEAACDGDYQGDESVCFPNPCPQSTGACCFPAGDCEIREESTCVNADGVFLGDETNCDSFPCSLFGACCVGTQCTLTDEFGCEGEFQGTASVCNPDLTCPTGACCVSSGCEILTANGCQAASGAFEGGGTVCDPDPCTVPATINFLSDGVEHFDLFSRICLRLQISGPDLNGASATIDFGGPSSEGTEILEIGFDGVVSLDRDIFFFGTYDWEVTSVGTSKQSFPLAGQREGMIEIDSKARDCAP